MSSLDIHVITFNCARNLIKPAVFAPHLFNATSATPDILVLCLQELAPIGYAFLGGSFLTPYFNAFRTAVQLADEGYVNVIARNVGLTAIMIFAKQEVASNIRWLQTAGVGVGVSEMGNKGAVGIRLGYGSRQKLTEMTFVSAHLAPMEKNLQRRNEDFRDIAQRLVFVSDQTKPTQDEQEEDTPLLQSSSNGEGQAGLYHPRSHLFFAGDLNYRTSILGPSADDVKTFPQPTKDPEDPQHYSQLLKEDQLSQQVKEGKTLHGLLEAPIEFLPTYKYRSHADFTLDSDQAWDWAPHRWPSWCDRVFYSPTSINIHSYRSLPLFGTSDHRPVVLAATVSLSENFDAYRDSSIPFSVDSNWRTGREAARRKEVAFGLLAYLTWTYEGQGLLLASTIGVVGGWLILRSLLAS